MTQSDPLLIAIGDRLDTMEERLAALEAAKQTPEPPADPSWVKFEPAQPDRHGKALGMTIGVVLLLFVAAAGVIGLIALWEAVV